MEEKSKIAEFYRDKSILITGGTGFVGKLLIDKLLRICQPKALYLLIRTKKSVDPQARLTDLFKSPVFDKLKSTVPDFQDKLILVPGDMMEPELGLSELDRTILVDKIQVVFHVAATVKFDEALPIATKINVVGTKCILDLSRQMSKLESIVYVSTAFSNCPIKRIEEDFYDPPISSDNLIKLTECLKDDQLCHITPTVIENWPNTYAFTKAVAEEAVKTHGRGLPIAVFRPAIIVSTKEDPIPGWIDNLYGPTGLMVGYAVGLIRVCVCGLNCKADLVPADMTINCLLATGYKTSEYPSSPDIPIYNFTTHKDNILEWHNFIDTCTKKGFEIPSSRTIWYYSLLKVRTMMAFRFLAFLCHILPALLVDTVLVALAKKPRALKIYQKVHKFSGVISYFSLRSWDFGQDNVNSLWQTLGKKDKELFNFDMKNLDWTKFLHGTCDGLRLYMLEEKTDSLPYAKRKFIVLWFLHRAVQAIVFSSVAWCLWRLGTLAMWSVARS